MPYRSWLKTVAVGAASVLLVVSSSVAMAQSGEGEEEIELRPNPVDDQLLGRGSDVGKLPNPADPVIKQIRPDPWKGSAKIRRPNDDDTGGGQAGKAGNFDRFMFNPQPEPPRIKNVGDPVQNTLKPLSPTGLGAGKVTPQAPHAGVSK